MENLPYPAFFGEDAAALAPINNSLAHLITTNNYSRWNEPDEEGILVFDYLTSGIF